MFTSRMCRILSRLIGVALLTACTTSPAAQPTIVPKADAGKAALETRVPPTGSPVAPTAPVAPVAPATSAATAPSPVVKTGPSPVAKTGPSPSPAARAASPAPAAAGNQVTFNAVDYSFSGPDTLPAGWTAVRLINQGREAHHVSLLRLAPGKTLADIRAAVQSGALLPAGLFTEEGGPNMIDPGAEGIAWVNLAPGTYVLACFVPSPDGLHHYLKGMIKPLTVTEAAGAAVALPRETLTIDAVDFGFRITPDVVSAGAQVIRFNNGGNQQHEVQLVRLNAGRVVQDIVRSMGAGAGPYGPPPGEFLGGVAGLEKDKSAYFPAQLSPGTYGLICFLPDATDPEGKPHFARGMMSQFTVR